MDRLAASTLSSLLSDADDDDDCASDAASLELPPTPQPQPSPPRRPSTGLPRGRRSSYRTRQPRFIAEISKPILSVQPPAGPKVGGWRRPTSAAPGHLARSPDAKADNDKRQTLASAASSSATAATAAAVAAMPTVTTTATTTTMMSRAPSPVMSPSPSPSPEPSPLPLTPKRRKFRPGGTRSFSRTSSRTRSKDDPSVTSSPRAAREWDVLVRTPSQGLIFVRATANTTLLDLKKELQSQRHVPPNEQLLWSHGQRLVGDRTPLLLLGVEPVEELRLEVRSRGSVRLTVSLALNDARAARFTIFEEDTIFFLQRQVAEALGVPVGNQLLSARGCRVLSAEIDGRTGLMSSDRKWVHYNDRSGTSLFLTDFSSLRPRAQTPGTRQGAHSIPDQGVSTRGITRSHLSKLSKFVSDHFAVWQCANMYEDLDLSRISMYQVAEWVLKPSTWHDDCSYAELVVPPGHSHRPRWFVSHRWAQPFVFTMACIDEHAKQRRLQDNAAYWMAAFARNLHSVDADLECGTLESTERFRALRQCRGLLLPLDDDGSQHFSRTWCCIEAALALSPMLSRTAGTVSRGPTSQTSQTSQTPQTSRQPARFPFDFVAAKHSGGVVLSTSGLTPFEEREEVARGEGFGWQQKHQREADFPWGVFRCLLQVRVEDSSCSAASARHRLLSLLAQRDPDKPLPQPCPELSRVNARLAAFFSTFAFPCLLAVKEATTCEYLPLIASVLRKARFSDSMQVAITRSEVFNLKSMEVLTTSFSEKLRHFGLDGTCCGGLDDRALPLLASALPPALSSLRLILRACPVGNAGVRELAQALGSRLTALASLSLDLGCTATNDAAVVDLSSALPKGLRELELRLDRAIQADVISHIGDISLKALTKALPRHLERLHLDVENTGVGDGAVHRLILAFPTSLKAASISLKGSNASEAVRLACADLHHIRELQETLRAGGRATLCLMDWVDQEQSTMSGFQSSKRYATTTLPDACQLAQSARSHVEKNRRAILSKAMKNLTGRMPLPSKRGGGGLVAALGALSEQAQPEVTDAEHVASNSKDPTEPEDQDPQNDVEDMEEVDEVEPGSVWIRPTLPPPTVQEPSQDFCTRRRALEARSAAERFVSDIVSQTEKRRLRRSAIWDRTSLAPSSALASASASGLEALARLGLGLGRLSGETKGEGEGEGEGGEVEEEEEDDSVEDEERTDAGEDEGEGVATGKGGLATRAGADEEEEGPGVVAKKSSGKTRSDRHTAFCLPQNSIESSNGRESLLVVVDPGKRRRALPHPVPVVQPFIVSLSCLTARRSAAVLQKVSEAAQHIGAAMQALSPESIEGFFGPTLGNVHLDWEGFLHLCRRSLKLADGPEVLRAFFCTLDHRRLNSVQVADFLFFLRDPVERMRVRLGSAFRAKLGERWASEFAETFKANGNGNGNGNGLLSWKDFGSYFRGTLDMLDDDVQMEIAYQTIAPNAGLGPVSVDDIVAFASVPIPDDVPSTNSEAGDQPSQRSSLAGSKRTSRAAAEGGEEHGTQKELEEQLALYEPLFQTSKTPKGQRMTLLLADINLTPPDSGSSSALSSSDSRSPSPLHSPTFARGRTRSSKSMPRSRAESLQQEQQQQPQTQHTQQPQQQQQQQQQQQRASAGTVLSHSQGRRGSSGGGGGGGDVEGRRSTKDRRQSSRKSNTGLAGSTGRRSSQMMATTTTNGTSHRRASTATSGAQALVSSPFAVTGGQARALWPPDKVAFKVAQKHAVAELQAAGAALEWCRDPSRPADQDVNRWYKELQLQSRAQKLMTRPCPQKLKLLSDLESQDDYDYDYDGRRASPLLQRPESPWAPKGHWRIPGSSAAAAVKTSPNEEAKSASALALTDKGFAEGEAMEAATGPEGHEQQQQQQQQKQQGEVGSGSLLAAGDAAQTTQESQATQDAALMAIVPASPRGCLKKLGEEHPGPMRKRTATEGDDDEDDEFRRPLPPKPEEALRELQRRLQLGHHTEVPRQRRRWADVQAMSHVLALMGDSPQFGRSQRLTLETRMTLRENKRPIVAALYGTHGHSLASAKVPMMIRDEVCEVDPKAVPLLGSMATTEGIDVVDAIRAQVIFERYARSRRSALTPVHFAELAQELQESVAGAARQQQVAEHVKWMKKKMLANKLRGRRGRGDLIDFNTFFAWYAGLVRAGLCSTISDRRKRLAIDFGLSGSVVEHLEKSYTAVCQDGAIENQSEFAMILARAVKVPGGDVSALPIGRVEGLWNHVCRCAASNGQEKAAFSDFLHCWRRYFPEYLRGDFDALAPPYETFYRGIRDLHHRNFDPKATTPKLAEKTSTTAMAMQSSKFTEAASQGSRGMQTDSFDRLRQSVRRTSAMVAAKSVQERDIQEMEACADTARGGRTQPSAAAPALGRAPLRPPQRLGRLLAALGDSIETLSH